jgi:hypothetical protein
MGNPSVVLVRAVKRDVADLSPEEFCKRVLLPAYTSLKKHLRLDLDDLVVDFRLTAAPRTQADMDLLAAMSDEAE